MTTPSTSLTRAELERRLDEREAEIVALKLLVETLKQALLKSRRARFGKSSEKRDAQPPVAANGVLAGTTTATEGVQRPAANRAEIDRSLPAHLPRELKVYRPDAGGTTHDAQGERCGCTACGGRLRQIGQDVSEQLEYVPARFKVIRHIQPRLACVACQMIFQAPAPSRPIERGVAGPALLAHVMVSKFCDHLPLYRLAGIHAREGVHFDPSTYGGWIAQTAALVDPLVAALGRYALAGAKMHGDDTPVAVLDPGQGKTRTGRLWVYVRDDRPAGSAEPPAAWYQYTPNRKGEHPQKHLADFTGILQADAYGGYGKIYATGRVDEALCMAHTRRPWWNLFDSQGRVAGSLADLALQRSAALYAIEAEIRGQPPQVRRRERQARAGPLLDDLHAWFTQLKSKVSAKSSIAKAIKYSLSRWKALALPRRRPHRDRQLCRLSVAIQ